MSPETLAALAGSAVTAAAFVLGGVRVWTTLVSDVRALVVTGQALTEAVRDLTGRLNAIDERAAFHTEQLIRLESRVEAIEKRARD